MIKKLNNNEGVKRSQTTAGQRELIREMRNTLNEVIDSVNDHEDIIYGCDCDDEDDNLCPDCRDRNPANLTFNLSGFSTPNLEDIRDEAEAELEHRSQESMMEGLDDEDDDVRVTEEVQRVVDRVRSDLKRVDTTDGLFSDFTAYVAGHPGLRLWQALRNWSGYSKIYGEMKDGDLDDTFYKKTKGPKE